MAARSYEDDEGTVLSNSTVTGNSASGSAGGNGGGLAFDENGTVSNVTISGNHASTGGGGIWEDEGVIVNNSLISGNTANLGGGVYADWIFQGASAAIVDNTASGANNAGGGVYVRGPTVTTGSTSRP